MESPLEGGALVILGAPRSGTSVVANAFRILGFFLGDDADFPEPKERNPAGIFERREILAFNNRCIDAMYLGHDRPDVVSIENHPAFPRLVGEASALLRAQFSGRARWGWKEPITTLLAPIYQAALVRDNVAASYLICVRRPSEVIASQRKIAEAATSHREAPIGPRAYRRWMSYTLKSLRFTRGARRALVAYHRLLDDPRSVLFSAFRAVSGGIDPDAFALDEACSSIRDEYYRNRGGPDVPEDAPRLVGTIWELCCHIADDPRGLIDGDYDKDVEQLESEFQTLSACFAEPEPPYGQVAFSVPGAKASFAAPVLPSKGWNEVDLAITAPASTDLVGSLYPLPANVYIRNARWESGPARLRAVNDTSESDEGPAKRFSLGFSSPQVTVRTPAEVGPYRLRLEVYVEMNIFTSFDALLRQTHRTRALETQIRSLTDQLCNLEAQNGKLKQEIDRLKPRPK